MNQKEIITAPMVSAMTPQGVIGMPLTCGALYILIMKTIKLNHGKVALVDDEDYEYLNQWKWFAHKHPRVFYAERTDHSGVKDKTILMHRLIMKTPKGLQVDHIDHDGLNNQKHNMRNCTLKQNTQNKRAYGKIKYSGVTSNNGYIRSSITIDGKYQHLGMFKTEEEAARAHDVMAKKYYGEFANLNFPENGI